MEKFCSLGLNSTEEGVGHGRGGKGGERVIKAVSQGHHVSLPCLPQCFSTDDSCIRCNVSHRHIVTGCKTMLRVIQVVGQPGPGETNRSDGVQKAWPEQRGFIAIRKLVHKERWES